MQIDQNLFATLYLLGFNFLGGDLFSGEIAASASARRGVEIRRRVAG
jgi:hypothetical protein